jgi:beta-glucosidase
MLFMAAMNASGCTGATSRSAGGASGEAATADPPADPRDVALLGRMTLTEKVHQLILFGGGPATGPDAAGRPADKTLDDFAREGIGSFMWLIKGAAEINRLQRIAVTESRLRIPMVFAMDIVHGYWTTFPVPIGVAATWDPEDARTMARVSGLEGYAAGHRWTFAPMLDHPVDPRWGRVVETFGEAPLLASDYGVASIDGFHRALADQPGIAAPRDFGVATCIKHLVGYGAVKAGKDYAYVDLSERALREFHMPPFAAAIAAGAPSIMPAFTTGLGGVPMTSNRRILRGMVREELGFDGILVSDFAAITELRFHGTAADDREATIQALRDGTITIDMQDGVYYAQLAKAVESGAVSMEAIDREVLRVLAFKRRLGLWENPYVPEDLERRVRLAPAHRAAALEVARKGVVLMKNEAGLLPLEGKRRILVVGPLADSREDLLGSWAALGKPEDTVTVLEGIRARAQKGPHAIAVSHREGCGLDKDGKSRGEPGDDERIAQAVAEARGADVVIAVVGERASMSGEARNRSRLDLPGKQQQLVDALVATGKPVVAVLLSGRALAVPDLVERAGAVVHSFFPGIEGGNALAGVLFGDHDPGGKQPVTWPRSVGQLPIHHYDHPNGRPNIPERNDYKTRWLDEVDDPLFPFGHGLSYTSFALDRLEVPERVRAGDAVVIRVRLTNTGKRAGDETPQLYIKPRVAGTVTARRLQGYRRVQLGAGESRVVEFMVPAERLAIYDADDRLAVEPGVYDVMVGTDAGQGLTGSFRLEARPDSRPELRSTGHRPRQ